MASEMDRSVLDDPDAQPIAKGRINRSSFATKI